MNRYVQTCADILEQARHCFASLWPAIAVLALPLGSVPMLPSVYSVQSTLPRYPVAKSPRQNAALPQLPQ